jgi:hypothetical protein
MTDERLLNVESALPLPVGEVQKPPKTHKPDRECPLCGTRLVRYNPGPMCYLHSPRVIPPENRAPRAPSRKDGSK